MYAIHGRWDAGHSKTSWLNGLSLVYVLVFNLVMSWQRSKKLQETNETCMHSHSFSHLRPIKPSVVSLARSSALSTDQRVSFHMTSYHISFSTGCFYYLGPEPCQCPHEICSGTFILGSVSGNINWLYYLVFFDFWKFWIFSPKIWVPSGAKVCKSCRSWKMLQNDYLVAKIGVDTAENEPRKEWCVVAMKTAKSRKPAVHFWV